MSSSSQLLFLVASISALPLGCSSAPAARSEQHASGGTSAVTSGGTTASGGSTAGTSGGTESTPSSGGTGGTSSLGGGAGTVGEGGTSSGGSGNPETCGDAPGDVTAPATTWVNATGNLAGMPSACANLSWLEAKPCSNKVLAGVVLHGLWETVDAGTTWTNLGSGAGSAVIENTTTSIRFDPVNPDVFWETGIHVGPGLFKTTDGGDTFQQLGTMTFSEGISVAFGDPDRNTLLVGTHGYNQQVYLSTDQGVSFTNVGLNLASDVSHAETPLVIDESTFLIGVHNCYQGKCGIYRTTDAGASWYGVSDVGINHYSEPLWASDGAIYWPVTDNEGLLKSTDLGETWTSIIGSGVIYGAMPQELPDGSIIAMGVDHILRSTDAGASWNPVGEPLPFALAGTSGALTYSAATKKVFIAQWDCGNAVLPNAIMSAGLDWEQ